MLLMEQPRGVGPAAQGQQRLPRTRRRRRPEGFRRDPKGPEDTRRHPEGTPKAPEGTRSGPRASRRPFGAAELPASGPGLAFPGGPGAGSQQGAPMNNLNEPPGWNILPNRREPGEEGGRWNYALLVPMLGLAAFRWIWTRECQKEIEKEKNEYYRKHSSLQKDLEAKYRDTITESRRAVAHLELELEKERNRTLSYREALVSQSRKLVEERRSLEQEQEKLEREKQVLLHSGAAGNLYQSCLAKEEEWQKRANVLLKEFEDGLKERQEIYCSLVVPRSQRLEIEKNLLVKAATDPVAVALHMESGLKDIFKHDNYCGNLLNRSRSQNGRLMWLYLRYWELAIELQKFKRVEKAVLGKR
ncbi:coiled-coil domain-containing protein 127 [Cygnus atratus]|uniref:coiled-coil domain-containing protein 127 n=1 Tax=Cygnus atratus TaxID=8868 RepID=UPI0015D5D2BD|nr:coiled-coil domain-containing protein 127 [Cygnus atratus]